MSTELRRQRVTQGLTYWGLQVQRRAAAGGDPHAIREELRELALRQGHLMLQGGMPLDEVRERLLEIAAGCCVPRAKQAVARGLWLADRKQRFDEERRRARSRTPERESAK